MHAHACGVTHLPRAPLEAMVEGAQSAVGTPLTGLKVVVARTTALDRWVEFTNALEVASIDRRLHRPIAVSFRRWSFEAGRWSRGGCAMPLRTQRPDVTEVTPPRVGVPPIMHDNFSACEQTRKMVTLAHPRDVLLPTTQHHCWLTVVREQDTETLCRRFRGRQLRVKQS